MSAWSDVDSLALAAGVEPGQVRGAQQRRGLTPLRRQIAARLDEKGYTCDEIGTAMALHHTSVLYLLRRTKASREQNKRYLSQETDSVRALMELQLKSGSGQ